MIKTPFIAVDGIINFENKLVLIERKNEPKGLALPGGFVDIGETVESAFIREMREELNISAKIERLFGVYSEPNRDPRFHTVSIVYTASTDTMPVAGDDAKKVFLFNFDALPFDSLVFDHAKILSDYLRTRE